jgi:hypothetical protein
MFDDTERNPFTRASGTGNLLTVVVHTGSFEDAILASDPLVETLLDLSRARCRVIWTPTDNEEVGLYLRRAFRTELGEYEAADEWLVIRTPLPVPMRHRIPNLRDLHRPALAGSRVTLLDELFTHPLAVDLFIVAEGDPFLQRDLRRRVYVSPVDALNLVRVLVTATEADDSYYYSYRASKLFPNADLPRVAKSIAGEHGFPQDLSEQIESFRHRIELILRAADRVAYHSLRRPDGRAAGKCGYHLAYFIMLVTGLFDELAWTMAQRYGLELNPQKVVLRARKDKAFFGAISARNEHLHAYLNEPTTQAIIGLFYPARDQVQHRAVLAAHLVTKPAPQRVLARLPADTIKEIAIVSADMGADWGLVGEPEDGQVDPYLFTLAAVRAVADVTNGVLGRLEWESYADLVPEDVREEQRGYFTSEIGLTRRQRLFSHKPPPYF